MNEEQKERIKQSLNHVHKWPSLYMFKFIVPTVSGAFEELTKVFPESADVMTKQSKTGKFTSITVKEVLMNADQVFERYAEVNKIEGVISL